MPLTEMRFFCVIGGWFVRVRGSFLGGSLPRTLVAPSPRPLTEIQDPRTSNLRSGCAQQHIQRGAEHSPYLITTDSRKLVQERVHRLIVFQKLEEQSDWNCCTDKYSAATTLSRVAFNHVFEIHSLCEPQSPQKPPDAPRLPRTQPGPPPGYPTPVSIFDLAEPSMHSSWTSDEHRRRAW